MALYIKINDYLDEVDVRGYMHRNEIKYETTNDPMDYVCEELVQEYIDDLRDNLKPLFVKIKPELSEYLKHNKEYFIDDKEVQRYIDLGIDDITDSILNRNLI